MTEAQPSKKRGGHTYGRRHLQLSNTAEEGELCLYSGHSLGRFSTHSMRYDSHAACTRCVAAAREGRMSFDIDRLLKKHRSRALKFWSQVDIGAPDECWNWNGCINPRTKQPQFAWRRNGISSSTQHHPQRVAMWFTWGDLGFAGVKTTCGNKYCCNPFHLIPQHIGVYVDDDSYLESFELACQLHTLKMQISEYMVEQALKEQEKIDQSAEIDARAALTLNPDTDFGEKFEAVITDLLAGRHTTQIQPSDPGLYREPIDNGEDLEDPTKDF
tara:strand:- start:2916 stop:3731 length:816 start_codon:yes stop_codon:yes gene_type:complete